MSVEDGGDGSVVGRSNYSAITFLHGSRSCIGQGFARAEIKCLAACVIGRFEVEMAPGKGDVWPAGVVTIKPGEGLWVGLRKLEGW